MNTHPGLDQWHLAPDHGSPNLRHRAAVITWIIGSVQSVLFGSCSALTTWAARLRPDELQGITNPEQLEQFSKFHPMLGHVAITLFVLGVVPGIVYLMLGFAVRTGSTIATGTALVLAITQSIVLGTIFIHNVLTAVLAHDPVMLTVNALTLGSLLALLGFGIRSLWLARQCDRDNLEAQTDPWNNPLS